MWNVIFFLIVASLGLAIRLGTYVVDEGTQVVITQFGQIIGEPSEALGSRELAKSRMDAIINGAVKDMVSDHAMVDTIRNSNRIVNDLQKAATQSEEGMAKSQGLNNQLKHAVTSNLELVTVGREHLTQKMYLEAQMELHKLGIDVVGLYIERVAYEPEVERKVYERMISERNRIAERLKSLGRGERERILGQIAQDSSEILGPAIREAESIRGEGDAGALAMYAEAFGQDPEFYNFWRSIQSYRSSLAQSTTIITSTESNYYRRLFEDPNNGLPSAGALEPLISPDTNTKRPLKLQDGENETALEGHADGASHSPTSGSLKSNGHLGEDQ